MAAYDRALASVRIPEVNLEVFDDLDGRYDRMKLQQDLARLGLALGRFDRTTFRDAGCWVNPL